MSGRSRHPEPDELLAFHFGALPEDERDPVEEHLSVCSDCAQAVLDFEAFPDLEGGPKIPPEVSRRLEDQKRSLLGMTRDAPGPGLDRSPVRRVASPGLAWALAAVFFVATVGLGVWSAGQRWTLDTDAVRVIHITAEASRAPGEPVLVTMNDRVTTLSVEVHERFLDYRIDLRTREGSLRASGRGFPIEAAPDGGPGAFISYTLPSELEPGSYFLDVFGLEDGEANPSGRVDLELVEPGSETRGDE